ncbi:MAG TPA: hypothetical protein VEL31_09720 [Ktedonobacteraceae bacterium]|nr:hypothetical protein [Ktedonobacteraceae bacterium]
MIDYEGKQYLTATEIARRLSISRGTCYNNILPRLQAYHLPGRKNALYRLSDVEQFSHVRVVARNTVAPLTMVM